MTDREDESTPRDDFSATRRQGRSEERGGRGDHHENIDYLFAPDYDPNPVAGNRTGGQPPDGDRSNDDDLFPFVTERPRLFYDVIESLGPDTDPGRDSWWRSNANRVQRRHRKVLETVLESAVSPEAVAEILRLFHVKTTILNKESDKIAFNANFRIGEINEYEYILCPVPFLFDVDNGFEVGFAVDVDPEYFVVKAYILNVKTKESIVLGRFPHCVHAAITMDADSFERLDGEIVATSNLASATFFITNLINDLAVGIDSPVEFFDDNLYLQLLNRITRDVTEDFDKEEDDDDEDDENAGVDYHSWISSKWCIMKFQHVMEQYHALDPASPFHENNVTRIHLHLHHLMFGFEDNLRSDGFVSALPRETMLQHLDLIYEVATSDKIPAVERLYNNKIDRILRIYKKVGAFPSAAFIQSAYASILGSCTLEEDLAGRIQDLANLSGVYPHRDLIMNAIYCQADDREFDRIPWLTKMFHVTLSSEEIDNLFEIAHKKREYMDVPEAACSELHRHLQMKPSPEYFIKTYKVDEFWQPEREVKGEWAITGFCEARVQGLVTMLDQACQGFAVQHDARHDLLVLSLADAIETTLKIHDKDAREGILKETNLANHLFHVYAILVERRKPREILELGGITGNDMMAEALARILSIEDFHDWITNLVKNDDFEIAATLAEALQMRWNPDPDVIEDAFTRAIKSMWLDAIHLLETMSGTMVPDKLVRARLERLVSEGNGAGAAILMARTGIYLPDRSNLCWWAKNLKTT